MPRRTSNAGRIRVPRPQSLAGGAAAVPEGDRALPHPLPPRLTKRAFDGRNRGAALPDQGPLTLLRDWLRQVQAAETEAELAALRRSLVRGAPLGEEAWQARTAECLSLQSTLRARGRPRKAEDERGV